MIEIKTDRELRSIPKRYRRIVARIAANVENQLGAHVIYKIRYELALLDHLIIGVTVVARIVLPCGIAVRLRLESGNPFLQAVKNLLKTNTW